MRFLSAALLAALAVAGCKSGPTPRPVTNRELPRSDLDQCLRRAKQMNPGLARPDSPGQLIVYMVVEPDGAASSAYIPSINNLDSTVLTRCVTDYAANAKFTGKGVDYLLPAGVEFVGASVDKRLIHDMPKMEFDPKHAQATLTFAEWAGPAEKAWGHLLTRNYPEAINMFRGVLQGSPDDVRALRGLAVALAESGGDLAEARKLADRAVELNPNTEATHEARLRVCVAQKDDECIYQSYGNAAKSPDVQVRGFELNEFTQAAKDATQRLQEADAKRVERERQQAEEQMKKADPAGCSAKQDPDERLLCGVKHCFGEGAKVYAQTLRPLTGYEYTVGEWKVANEKGKKTVQAPIRAKKKGAQNFDAVWSVGENGVTTAASIAASNIAQKYNECRQ